jgi:hypothetical protein
MARGVGNMKDNDLRQELHPFINTGFCALASRERLKDFISSGAVVDSCWRNTG